MRCDDHHDHLRHSPASRLNELPFHRVLASLYIGLVDQAYRKIAQNNLHRCRMFPSFSDRSKYGIIIARNMRRKNTMLHDAGQHCVRVCFSGKYEIRAIDRCKCSCLPRAAIIAPANFKLFTHSSYLTGIVLTTVVPCRTTQLERESKVTVTGYLRVGQYHPNTDHVYKTSVYSWVISFTAKRDSRTTDSNPSPSAKH